MEKRWYRVWPPVVPKSFEAEKPISEYLRDWTTLTPEKLASSFYGRDISYRELNEAIDRFAVGLASLGVKKGDRVGLYMQNCPQFVISYFGALRAGVVVVPLNPMFKHAELEYQLNDSEAETLVSLDILYPEVEKIKDSLRLKNVILTSLRDYLPERPTLPLPSEAEQPKSTFPGTVDFLELLRLSLGKPVCEVDKLREDLALFVYTGGTTGLPKGAIHTHQGLAHAVICSKLWYDYSSHDIDMGVTPFFHVMGMIQDMCVPLVSGGRIIILPRFSPEVVAEAITQYKCTTWVAAPTMIIALFGLPNIEKYDFTALRYLWTGGSSIPAEIQKRIKQLAPNAFVGEGYGLSETLSQGGAITPFYRHKPGLVGIPNVGIDMKIVDLEAGQKELGPDEEGEIIIKGPPVMKGYWKKPKETEEALRDGWLYTGDIGAMDEEGYVRIAGRRKELIICSGYNVYPADVEALLHKHPAIAETAIIGIPDPYRGESPKAFVVLRPEYQGKVTGEEILQWCKENMAAYKRPRVVEFREELPKSAAGKVLRRILAEEETRKGVRNQEEGDSQGRGNKKGGEKPGRRGFVRKRMKVGV